MSTGSHFEFEFLQKPIVYGVARLLYSFATSDSVIDAFVGVSMIAFHCKVLGNLLV